MGMQTARRIGGFCMLEALKSGSGSQGTVHKAVCENAKDGIVPVGTVVAVKTMPVQDESDLQWKNLAKRTAALSEIRHPGIVRYLGCLREKGAFNDTYAVVQEFLEGETLKDVLSRSPFGLDVDEAIRIMGAVLSALDYLAVRGIVHRDLKPGNIFITKNGQAKIIDFEIAKNANGTTISTGSNIRGSFDYMAPEFADQSFHGDVFSDVFSMGVVFHEMLTGRTPYSSSGGKEANADFAFHSRWNGDEHSPIRINGRVRRLLVHADEVLETALSRDRSDRFANFADFRAALGQIRMRVIRNDPNTYLLLQFIGKGGFGEVFKARVKATGELVAVKHLLKAAYAARFRREAKIMSMLDSPCFVRLVDFFFADAGGNNEAFLVMSFLPGMPGNSLRDAIKGAAGVGLPYKDVLVAFERYATGLVAMHSRGLFHRDIKPSNLYYPNGRPGDSAIMDLGIARDVNGTATTGYVPGTLDYMPPEVVTTESRGESGMDIYALGLCLYEALTGRMGYPRLPTGSAAYPAFFSRAREMKPPVFDAPELAGRDELLSLLKDMTVPDVASRLNDANVVVRRIRALLGEKRIASAPGPRPVTPPQPRPQPRPRPAPPSQSRQRTTVAPAPPPRSSSVRIQRQDPRPIRATSVPRPRMEVPAFLYLILSGVAIAVVSVAVIVLVFGSGIKERWAEHRINAILERIRYGEDDLASSMESEWLARWSPAEYGWCRLDAGQYSRLKNKLADGKAEIRRELDKRTLEHERDEARKACIARIASARRIDGTLDEAGFKKMDGWTVPAWMEKEEALTSRLSGLDKCIIAAIMSKLRPEPVETRRERLSAAREMFANSWTSRLLGPTLYEKTGKAIVGVSSWCVGTVGNLCSDTISVDGADVASGASRVVIFKDGRPQDRKVTRKGYKPVDLPADLDGNRFDLKDESFVSLPVKVDIPALDRDIACSIGGRPCRSGESIDLSPGSYECRYRKADCKEQKIAFTVRPNMAVVVPEPEEWEFTEQYKENRRRIEKAREDLLNSPVAVTIPSIESGVTCEIDGGDVGPGTVKLRPGEHIVRYGKTGYEPQTSRFTVEAGEPLRLEGPMRWETLEEAEARKRRARIESLKDSVRRKCEALWGNEPIEDRQNRLEDAGVRVARAIFDGVITEEEGRPLLAEIDKRKKWLVGKIENQCLLPVSVGGHSVGANESKIIVFENGLPDEWSASMPGHENLQLLRDFDGRTIVFKESDFVPLDVVVKVPTLAKGVSCFFEGVPISGQIKLKPGRYFCIYRQGGYRDQKVTFTVAAGGGASIPPPGQWRVE